MSDTPRLEALLSRHEGMSEGDWCREYAKLERELAAVGEEMRERCAKVLDDLHAKISDGWDFYSDERADGARNTLTNGAKLIRALAQPETGVDTQKASR